MYGIHTLDQKPVVRALFSDQELRSHESASSVSNWIGLDVSVCLVLSCLGLVSSCWLVVMRQDTDIWT